MSGTVRIGILDSGVAEGHPHLPSVHGGVGIAPGGDRPEFRDVLGHGTAVAALVHFLAPAAEIYAVKIFDSRLATTFSAVLRGMEWCLANGMDIVNLSLGTRNPEHREAFAGVIERARARGVVVVSAFDVEGETMLPGSMPGVVGVTVDATLDHGDFAIREVPTAHVLACPYARDIEGIPREHNLRGVSFAVAHVSAAIATRWKGREAGADWTERLRAEAGQIETS